MGFPAKACETRELPDRSRNSKSSQTLVLSRCPRPSMPVMKRIPDPDLPPSRAALPEGCSDLFDAYKVRAAAREERAKFLLRTAAMLHDPLVAQLDPELLRSRNPDLLLARISDFLHPLLLSDREFARQVGSSSELVEELFHVLMANLEEGGE